MIRKVLLTAALLSLASCGGANSNLHKPHRVDSQEKAGAITLAATMVAQWEDYVSTLDPEFSLTEAQALAKVIPQTTLIEEKVIDALGAGLSAGLPRTSTSGTETTSIKDGVTTSSSSTTKTKEAGQPPETGGAAAGAGRKASDLPGIPDDMRKLGQDSMLEYLAATALFQEVKLLSRYVTDAALKENYRPYLLRLQIGVVPYARNQPYDTYMRLAFFTENGTGAGVEVLPLLVTDNLEGTLKSRSVDTIRQLALALSFMTGGFGGSASLNSMQESLNSVLGTDKNSLLTVGRITDNTIQVRLGASREPTAGYAMIPRTHNVTLVVLLHEDLAKSDNKDNRKVTITAQGIFRDAETGRALPQRTVEDDYNNIETLFSKHFSKGELPKVTQNFCYIPGDQCNPETRRRNAMSTLIGKVIRNDWPKFKETLKNAGWENPLERNLWLEVVEMLTRRQFTGTRVELPKSVNPAWPDRTQTVLLLDDTKKMTATLRGGAALTASRLTASLDIELIDKDATGKNVVTNLPLTAEAVALKSGGKSPTITFPSLAAWKIDNLNANGSRLKNARLTLSSTTEERRLSYIAPTIVEKGVLLPDALPEYSSLLYKKISVTPKPVFSMWAAVAGIVAKEDKGSAKIHIKFKKANGKPLASQVEIEVANADLSAARDVDKKTDLTPKLGKVVVSGDTTLALSLENLIPDKAVTIKAVAKNGANQVGGPHDDITLSVVAAPKK